ncbi:MAG: rhodanese-like domain-containing protein [Acidobacteriia bacterium]|nr:rhodanese-like domain-containing protein [Terriglobia bacterium]
MSNTKPARAGLRRSALSRGTTLLPFAMAMAWMLAALPILLAAKAEAGPDPWKPADLIEPKDLNAMLASPRAQKPLIVYVGFDFLYDAAHIPGALYFGPARTPKGLAALSKWAHTVPRGKLVVMYCGCCPWNDCPNIRPAFKALRDAGVKNLKVLHIPHNLLRDWINQSYPVEKGSADLRR